jgi:transposase
LDALRAELRHERHAERKRRLHLLVLIASGEVRTRQEAAEHLAVHRITIGRWLNGYQDEGLAGLLRIGTPGAPAEQRTLSPAAYEALQARLAEPEGFGSYTEIQQWLAESWGEEVPYQAVHRVVQGRLKAKLKRSRPRHPKKTTAPAPPSPSV